ncbi:MAG: PDZ domain-containing protein [Kiritimatiellae bacterium]|nr:PDZ domain-containing protein [Kiritimatiellia bacterium]
MKKLFAVLVAAAAAAAAGAPKGPSIAAKCARNRELNAKFAASCAEVRVWFKLEDSGDPPRFGVSYLCPNCNDTHERRASEYLNEDRPYEGAAFAVAADRFLVQDQHLLARWVDRFEIVFGGVKYPASALKRYPAEDALELKTAAPVKGIKPLEFSKRVDFTRDDAGVFFFSAREDGLSVCGVRGGAPADFTHYADTGADIAKTPGNAVAVNASNEAVTVSFRRRIVLGRDTFAPPAEWRGEPAGAFDGRWLETENRFLKSCVPLYLHLDDEDNRKNGFSRRYRSYRRDSESTDIDLVGLALPEGEVLAELRLDASKLSEIDRIEARFADGTKAPLEFVGAFGDYALAVLRFADGKAPPGVEPVRLDETAPVKRFLEPYFKVNAVNYNGKVKAETEYGVIEGYKTGRGGEPVPDVSGFSYNRGGGTTVMLCADGSVGGVSSDRRVGGSEYSSDREFVSAAKLAALVNGRDFDPQFAIRKGKDRVRVAWAGVETQRMTEELAREKMATALMSAAKTRGALVTRVWPGSPAAKAGIAEGDVLLNARLAKSHTPMPLQDEDAVEGFDWEAFFSMFGLDGDFPSGASPWPNVEGGVNRTFTRFGIGKKTVIAYSRGGVRKEAELTLEQAPVHYQTARRIKNKRLGMIVSDMTFEVRGYFKFDEKAPGVVVVKVQPGNPAAIGGLRPLEIITHVNNEPVSSAKDFARRVKGAAELTFSVRRLAATRVVRIELKKEEPEKKEGR